MDSSLESKFSNEAPYLALIGNTPMVELAELSKELGCRILAKVKIFFSSFKECDLLNV